MDNKFIQKHLKDNGYDPGPIDGIVGTRTLKAIEAALKKNQIKYYYKFSPKRKQVAYQQIILKSLDIDTGKIDGYVGPQTRYALEVFDTLQKTGRKPEPWRDSESTQKNAWPHQSQVSQFYGPVGQNQVKVELPYPMKLAWNPRQIVTKTSCHTKVADSLQRVLTKVKEHYGMKEIEKLRLDYFGGMLNVRKMRGGSSWSMHSWGIALDMDPINNQLRWGRDRASLAKPVYEDWWKCWEDEGWYSLGRRKNYDWMHVQAARI